MLWQWPNLTSLSFHAERHFDLLGIIHRIAVHCPKLQVLKVRSVETSRYWDDSDIGSLLELVEHCPHLHSLFLWNIVIEEMADLITLKQLEKLILFAEAATQGLNVIYSDEEYEQNISRVFVQEKMFYWSGCQQNRKAVSVTWKGLSTLTMGEYIAEVVPNMRILHTSCYSDCVFILPILRQCRNISRVHLNNCVHLTAATVFLIVTLPCLYDLELDSNNTLEHIIPVDRSVVCEAVELNIHRFTNLQVGSLEYLVKCCPNLNHIFSNVSQCVYEAGSAPIVDYKL